MFSMYSMIMLRRIVGFCRYNGEMSNLGKINDVGIIDDSLPKI